MNHYTNCYVAISDLAKLNAYSDNIVKIDRDDYVKMLRASGMRWQDVASDVVYSSGHKRTGYFQQYKEVIRQRREGNYKSARYWLNSMTEMRKRYPGLEKFPK